MEEVYTADLNTSSSHSVILLRKAFTSCLYRSSAQVLNDSASENTRSHALAASSIKSC